MNTVLLLLEWIFFQGQGFSLIERVVKRRAVGSALLSCYWRGACIGSLKHCYFFIRRCTDQIWKIWSYLISLPLLMKSKRNTLGFLAVGNRWRSRTLRYIFNISNSERVEAGERCALKSFLSPLSVLYIVISNYFVSPFAPEPAWTAHYFYANFLINGGSKQKSLERKVFTEDVRVRNE